jgi:hypothetical protein
VQAALFDRCLFHSLIVFMSHAVVVR